MDDPVLNMAECVKHITEEAAHMQLTLSHMPDIIAVTKTHGPEKIRPLLDAGHKHYGENRVQEAQAKFPDLRKTYDFTLHLIGPLQSNKCEDAVATFDVIHTVDREKVARKLAAAMKEQARDLPCYIQVNTGEEEQKSGIAPKDTQAFLDFCRAEGLSVEGLMCIPPVDEPAGVHFALLKKLAEENGPEKLSMGMSGDYELAAVMGASYVRIGSAIFGKRGDSPWRPS